MTSIKSILFRVWSWTGTSANFFSKFVNKLYCFDSFEGLKEDWVAADCPKDILI